MQEGCEIAREAGSRDEKAVKSRGKRVYGARKPRNRAESGIAVQESCKIAQGAGLRRKKAVKSRRERVYGAREAAKLRGKRVYGARKPRVILTEI